jgi:hypothetical protein
VTIVHDGLSYSLILSIVITFLSLLSTIQLTQDSSAGCDRLKDLLLKGLIMLQAN